MVFEGLVGLGIAFLLAPAIAEYAKVRGKADRGFNWIAVAGVMFLFSATFSVGAVFAKWGLEVVLMLEDLFIIVGWLFALIGTIFVVYEKILEK